MTLFLLIVVTIACLILIILWMQEQRNSNRLRLDFQQHEQAAQAREQDLQFQIGRLARWSRVADADDKARQLIEQANNTLNEARQDAHQMRQRAREESEKAILEAQAQAQRENADAKERTRKINEKAQAALAAMSERSAEIIRNANRKAEEIAGKAFDAVKNAEFYEKTAKAMKNVIKGYGDEYLKPAENLLDDLAEDFAHTEAGQQLKIARDHARQMITNKLAANCDYVEVSRKERAEHFVIDAFNGRVDSILSRVKHDNYGKLEQEIRDAFTLVNHGGQAFRDARITEEYLVARLAELKWATINLELKRKEKEEQRLIREQIREEEKARREFEKAMKEAAKEEKLLRSAMAKAQKQIEAATEEQRIKFEAEMAELQIKLQEAEDRNQRAVSMAQQTRRGHVYIISNVGSFGDNIYKIGLTRRLEPMDRIKELGDASVPFEFDVHAIIMSDDAPALETALHKQFMLNQVNKVNHRKEFFRANLVEIRKEIEDMGIQAKWTMVAEAMEYRETIAIERAIEDDPQAQHDWLNRQLTLDPVTHKELETAIAE